MSRAELFFLKSKKEYAEEILGYLAEYDIDTVAMILSDDIKRCERLMKGVEDE